MLLTFSMRLTYRSFNQDLNRVEKLRMTKHPAILAAIEPILTGCFAYQGNGVANSIIS